ncbi:MAG: cold-shock protein [Bacteroidales bacterium]|nr:cold-shock protein [Bacteroidales bacterium]
MPDLNVNSVSVYGIVQWFDSIRGIGFIKTEAGNMVFVNYTDLPIKNGNFIVLRPNQKVVFDISVGSRGPQAKNIKIVN